MSIDPPPKTLPDLSGYLILLAEDNETNQMVACEMLAAMGARVALAVDGAEALEMISAKVYDALIVDIEMPRISGLDVIRSVRENGGPQARRPLIALTAYPREDHGAAILSAGADQVISKPIPSIEALGAAVLSAAVRGAGAPAHALMAGAPGAAHIQPGPRAEHVAPDILFALIDTVGRGRMAELLGKVIRDIAATSETCARAAPAGDMDALRGATHVLMSVAGTVGALRLQRMAEQMNDLAHASMAAKAEFYAAALLTEANQVILTLMREKERT
jgi:two-component system aerobic respiration control sensor histidine kinase ArcB